MFIVFYESEVKLKNIVKFSQWVVDQKRLITLIAENHNAKFDCGMNSEVNVSQYCLERIKQNPKTFVFLEYAPAINIEKISSKNIRQIYDVLTGIGYTKNIIPYDYRTYYLGDSAHKKLYTRDITFTEEEIRRMFIKPFYDKGKSFELNKKYKRENKIILEKYLERVKKEFEEINELEVNIIKKLRRLWMKITDWYILREILSEENRVDEFIVLSGYHHIDNLIEVLRKTGIDEIANQTGEAGKCVNLMCTYKFG